MTDYTDPATLERATALGIAILETHTMASIGPTPADWQPGPQTMSQAREALAHYADRHFLNEVNAGCGVTVQGIESALDARDNWPHLVHSHVYLGVLGVARRVMRRAYDRWPDRQ